ERTHKIDQRIRRCGAVLAQPRQRPFNLLGCCSRWNIRPLQPDEDCAANSVGYTVRQPCLAAEQRAGEVGDWFWLTQLEALAAPRPGEIEYRENVGWCRVQAGEFGRGRRLAPRNPAAKIMHTANGGREITHPGLERGLMRLQRQRKGCRFIAAKHAA